jgi:uncharacterized protein with NAD-binding domain and iron-sulfur cluster
MGVTYHLNSRVIELHYDSANNRVQGATVEVEGRRIDIEADHVVLAVPAEVAVNLIPDGMKADDPALSRIANLKVEWMNGIQFFLSETVLQGFGHTIYFDSPWAVTSIAQKQYWADTELSNFGDGRVRDVLSVDVSDWNNRGILYGKTAKQCTKDEVIAEVWAQMKAHLNEGGRTVLRDDMIVHVHVDPGIGFREPGHTGPETTNSEPLLINTAGSWSDRPEAFSEIIENFYLASDYVRTHMDLACMDAACEAARRGVNKLFERAGRPDERCIVSPLEEPVVFAPFKAYDRRRFLAGKPHDATVVNSL